MFIRAYWSDSTEDQLTVWEKELIERLTQKQGYKFVCYYARNINEPALEKAELRRLLMDCNCNDILLVEKINHLATLGESCWMILKEKMEQHDLRIVCLDLPTSWKLLSVKSPAQTEPVIHAVITTINNIITEFMSVMAYKEPLSYRQRQKQGIARAHALGKYRGKQADQERHRKVMYCRQIKKLSIRETADATGYSISQVCRIQALYRK